MDRVYHHYLLWEDHKQGFYDNVSGEKKKYYLKKCVEMFNSEELTYLNMKRVINEWKRSCEHNLTNPSLNKIAYIGQGACCIYCGSPSTVTMESWSLLSEEVKKRSDKIANLLLNEWNKKNKIIQLCLKLD